jgi:hypothetical protein
LDYVPVLLTAPGRTDGKSSIGEAAADWRLSGTQ